MRVTIVNYLGFQVKNKGGMWLHKPMFIEVVKERKVQTEAEA